MARLLQMLWWTDVEFVTEMVAHAYQVLLDRRSVKTRQVSRKEWLRVGTTSSPVLSTGSRKWDMTWIGGDRSLHPTRQRPKVHLMTRICSTGLQSGQDAVCLVVEVRWNERSPFSCIDVLCACVYIYIRQLSSFRAPMLWFIDLTVAICHIQYTFLTKHENTRSPPFSYDTKMAADSY